MNYKIISASLFMDFMKLSESDKNSFNTILDLNANNKIKELGSLHENFEVDWHLKDDLRDRLKELGFIYDADHNQGGDCFYSYRFGSC
jgi:hypothetical protein